MTKRQITLINVRGIKPNDREGITYIGRPCSGWPGSPLANQWREGQHGTRAEVVERYDVWLHEAVKTPGSAVSEALEKIIHAVYSGESVVLGCWCAPKQCHGDAIISMVNDVLDMWESTSDEPPWSEDEEIGAMDIKSMLKADLQAYANELNDELTAYKADTHVELVRLQAIVDSKTALLAGQEGLLAEQKAKIDRLLQRQPSSEAMPAVTIGRWLIKRSRGGVVVFGNDDYNVVSAELKRLTMDGQKVTMVRRPT